MNAKRNVRFSFSFLILALAIILGCTTVFAENKVQINGENSYKLYEGDHFIAAFNSLEELNDFLGIHETVEQANSVEPFYIPEVCYGNYHYFGGEWRIFGNYVQHNHTEHGCDVYYSGYRFCECGAQSQDTWLYQYTHVHYSN